MEQKLINSNIKFTVRDLDTNGRKIINVDLDGMSMNQQIDIMVKIGKLYNSTKG